MNFEHEDKTEYTLKTARSVSLSDAERAAMKKNIRLFMKEHPVKESFIERALSHVWTPRVGLTITPVYGYGFRSALAGVLIVFLIGTGASYASERALPGDILYPVKTSVNENIRAALAVSEEAKTRWSATLAARRLEEAGVLAAEGRLTDSTRADIESRLEKHVENFEIRTNSLAQTEGSAEVVADAQSFFEVNLKAHASVLAELSAVNPKAEQELRSILRAARTYAETVGNARVATERTIVLKDGRSVRERAMTKKQEAENEYLATRTQSPVSATAQKSAISESNTTEMMMSATLETTTLSDPALEALNAGTERFNEGEYYEAFTAFQEVLRNVQEEEIKHKVRKHLKLDIDEDSSSEENHDDGKIEIEPQHPDSMKDGKNSPSVSIPKEDS